MANVLLDNQAIKDIEQLVEGLIAEYGGEEFDYKVLVRRIAEGEKIELREAELRDVSGALYKNDGKWILVVNSGDATARKIFTIAHELGHYFLHKKNSDQFVDGGLVNSFYLRSETEKFNRAELEANEFAGNLLMPKKEIEAIMAGKEVFSYEDVALLASKFGVSDFAMNTRLKNLNYRSGE